MAPKKHKGNEPLAIPIKWHFPKGLISRYASNMLVQFTENECNLSFFEIKPPLLLGDLDKAKATLKSIKAECVARIVVSTGRIPEFLKALNGAWEQYSQQHAAQDAEDSVEGGATE